MQKKLGILRSRIIYYWKPFNRKRLRNFYKIFIREGDLAFDIGAHLGNRTSTWLKLGAQVVAVEPQPQCIDFLEEKFNKQAKLSIEKVAIGASRGKAQLHISALHPTVSTLANKEWRDMLNAKSSAKVSWPEMIEVDVMPLDDLIKKYGTPVFCKIDVENFELEVLQGLSTPIPALSFEFFTNQLDYNQKCIDCLEKLGNYEYNISMGENLRLEWKQWKSTVEIIEVLKTRTFKALSGDIYARIKKASTRAKPQLNYSML